MFSPKTMSVLIFPLAMPSEIFTRLIPISVKQIPVSRAPFVFGFLSALTRILSPVPSRGIESLIAPSLVFSFEISQSSSFVCRAEAMMATEPAGAFLSLSEISLSAAVQVDF